MMARWDVDTAVTPVGARLARAETPAASTCPGVPCCQSAGTQASADLRPGYSCRRVLGNVP